MSYDYQFKYSSPDSSQSYEFQFTLSKSDSGEQQSQIKVGDQFYKILPQKPEDLAKIKNILEKSIAEKKIGSLEELKNQITAPDATSADVLKRASEIEEVAYRANLESLNRLKRQTVQNIAQAMQEKYVFVGKGMDAAKYVERQLQDGAYDAISDPEVFASALTADLRQITEDKHIQVALKIQTQAPQSREPITVNHVEYGDLPLRPDLVNIKAYIAPTNIGWMGMEMGSLPYEYKAGFLAEDPSIGYFDLCKFGVCKADASCIEDVAARRAAFKEGIAHLQEANAIIIDLRNNSGGDPSAVQLLCSLFMKENIPLNRIEWRTPEGPKSEDFRTLSENELPREKRLLSMPLYILNGPWTFSAAEEFANNMKVNERATIVGQVTAGGANPCRMHSINDVYEMFIPTGRAVNPIQKGNWEGVGIIPDHLVLEEQALDQAVKLIHAQKKSEF